MPKQDNRFAGLEILRFLSALAVLLWHYSMFAFHGDKIEDYERTTLPFYTLFQWFYERGLYAVPYFWCISGFIFFWKYQTAIYDKMRAYNFFVLRFSRLYPLHLVTLILVALLQAAAFHFLGSYQIYTENTVPNFLLHLFMLGNWLFPYHLSFNGPIWSVSIEIAAYATFYCLCRATRHSTAAAFVIAAIATAIHLETNATNQFNACLVFFYLGGIVCAVQRWLTRSNLETWVAMLLCIAAAWYWFYGDTMPVSGHLRLVIVIPLVVLLCTIAPFFNVRPVYRIAEVGNLTYALYLLHTPASLLLIIAYRSRGLEVPYHSPIFFISFYGLLIPIAALVYVYFEAPAQNLLRSILIKRRQVEILS